MSLKNLFRKVEQVIRPVLKSPVGAAAVRVIPGVGPVASAVMTARNVLRSTAPSAVEIAAQRAPMSIVRSQPMPRLPAPRAPQRPAPGGPWGQIPGMGGGGMGLPIPIPFGRGQAAAPRRRRRKGISGSELKAFTRVTAVLNKYCKTPPPMRRRTSRSSKCR